MSSTGPSTGSITAAFMHNAPARLSAAAALLLTAGATADFTGWKTEVMYLPSGRYVVNIYAGFSNSLDRVQGLFDVTATTSATDGFYQSPEYPFWQPSSTQNAMTSDDSWVTIGTHPTGSGNSAGSIVAPAPGFVNFDDGEDATDFSFLDGAGWYNGNPQNAWGYANVGQLRVLVAHFVFTQPSWVTWSGSATVRLANGSTPNVGMGDFTVPPPPLNSDWDHDGVLDINDNCIAIFNPDQADCNDNGIGDACEIATGVLPDSNGNGVPDLCECTGDITQDGMVNGADIGALLAQWGAAGPGAAADLNGDGTVDGADIGVLLAAWGVCGG